MYKHIYKFKVLRASDTTYPYLVDIVQVEESLNY